jgi:hypothetical protein
MHHDGQTNAVLCSLLPKSMYTRNDLCHRTRFSICRHRYNSRVGTRIRTTASATAGQQLTATTISRGPAAFLGVRAAARPSTRIHFRLRRLRACSWTTWRLSSTRMLRDGRCWWTCMQSNVRPIFPSRLISPPCSFLVSFHLVSASLLLSPLPPILCAARAAAAASLLSSAPSAIGPHADALSSQPPPRDRRRALLSLLPPPFSLVPPGIPFPFSFPPILAP